MIVRGAETGTFIQEIPVPIGMWQPFSNRGVPLEFAGTGTMRSPVNAYSFSSATKNF